MTLLDGDRMRLCLHPRVVPHPLPEKLPVRKNGNRIIWEQPNKPNQPYPIFLIRCLECGLVGEAAK